MIRFRKLFSVGAQSPTDLTQGHREAILDLLNYCAAVDHDIAHSEETAIDDLEYQLGWDHGVDFDYSVNRSVGKVRGALESKDEAGFLAELRDQLDTAASRELAVMYCEALIKADGMITPEESATFAAVKRALA